MRVGTAEGDGGEDEAWPAAGSGGLRRGTTETSSSFCVRESGPGQRQVPSKPTLFSLRLVP